MTTQTTRTPKTEKIETLLKARDDAHEALVRMTSIGGYVDDQSFRDRVDELGFLNRELSRLGYFLPRGF